ncbi:MAG TPA: DUF222 domain-containing protein [Acidimicrobiia bacterium]|nr:DUF222 domain-containing protein [Acidimicrobiia bacterium]
MFDPGGVGHAAENAVEGFEQSEFLARLRSCPTEELKVAFGQLDALENAVRVQRLHVLAVLDERDAGGDDGALDTEGWVAAQSLVTRPHAVQQVATARKLEELPRIAEVAARGELSWDQLVPLAQIATAKDDGWWADNARGYSPAQLAYRARVRRTASNAADLERQRQRSLVWWFDARVKMLRLKGRLTPEQGEQLIRALERIVERDPMGPDGMVESWEARYADALAELAGMRLTTDADPDRACVVVHVEHDTATGFVGEYDEPISPEVCRRLACDALIQVLIRDAFGNPVGLSARQRTVSPALARVLRHRDRTCRFPGCNRTWGLQAHHMVHHEHGGPTEAWNLMMVCPRHHRWVHEHRWSVRGDPNRADGLVFRRPDGRVYAPGPPPLDPNTRDRIFAA